MSAQWVSGIQSKVYTIVKVRAENNLRPKYKDIRFTQDDSAQLEPQFPTVYIHYLQDRELATDLENNEIQAFMCNAQIDVTVSKAQGKTTAQKVMDEVVEQFKKLRFGLRGTPVFVATGSDTKQLSARVSRAIGSSDTV